MHLSIDRASVAHAPARRAPRLMGGLTALGAAGLLVVTASASSVLAAQGDDTVLVNVVDRVSPSVVTIQVTVAAETSADGSGVATPESSGSGSGVIIDPSGLILTNRHVAGDATKVTVILKDGTRYDGETVGVDTLTDFAFVKVDATDLPAASLGESSGVQVGQLAIAMGNPLGDFPGTITAGIVSGLDREITVTDQMGGDPENLRHLIQTDAAINPGNSGGPLVDGDGAVVGINTAASAVAYGIGFALPIDLAKPIIDQVLAGKPIERPYIGIRYQDLDAQIAADNELTVTMGAWVRVADGEQAVLADSPAKDAGLKDGDIITAIDGQAVDREHPLDLLLLQHAPGDRVELSVLRGDQSIAVSLTLGTRPAAD
jgi:S1-C subfamily serine protease